MSSHSFSRISLMVIVLLLAIVQLVVQLIFFLHLDRATKAPWNIIILLFTGMVVSVVVFGSLWIMHNLDYHMLPGGPAQAETYMREHEGL